MRSFAQWPAPLPGGSTSEEQALTFNQGRGKRVLIVPALFDEANKLRRLTVEVMHRLDLSGIDSILPDLPGCNESVQPLNTQTLEGWQTAASAAAEHFEATHLLTIRSGALLAPDRLPGWRYAAHGGKQLMRSMLRARTIASREAGREETMAELEETGRALGIELAGWQIGPEMFAALSDAQTPANETLADIPTDAVPGAGLWLRAEPDEDPEQADAIAAIIAIALSGS
ncbi:hypothetical protein QWY75_03500 [Pontixanthobacter aestiaquae]|uniref:Uncharacterized protein n=1 Tax=Pontixanthobacter aestiaquae TaxID=1509367 RepID=A0A844Z9L5_9SPHN|nr:hypothetical protein [Pontixanthobacter aestiaquae]MDN3645271.1 hypothetical protein [Pontixanthobacter aestiaquae]MXO83727.1 hypothetical protein [Pontixanthobacter aestiaquae]